MIPTSEPTTTAATVDPFCRRTDVRVPGPFEARRLGKLETTVTLFDISRGGAFVLSMHEQREGAIVRLKIDLPGEAGIVVNSVVVNQRPGGFAVRFVDVPKETEARLERGLRRLLEGPAARPLEPRVAVEAAS